MTMSGGQREQMKIVSLMIIRISVSSLRRDNKKYGVLKIERGPAFLNILKDGPKKNLTFFFSRFFRPTSKVNITETVY